jgi:4-amino-4-deoxy-L-arabinose transferase-like glycosyltransferase/Flp pilus assembly protein TadD
MSLRNDKTFVLTLLGVGLIGRLAYFLEYKKLLEFLHPTVDALFHHLTATAIASGALTSTEPFFRAPFYSYFLGLIYFLTGDSIALARLAQLLIGAFTPVLTYLIARKTFDKTIAVVASILVLFCSDLVYFEGELLLESLVVTLVLLVWYAYLRYRESPRWHWLALSGLAAGLAVITRPNAGLLSPIMIYLLWLDRPKAPKSIPTSQIALFLAVMFVPVALVLAHNLTRSQPAFTIATQGGINFYIGNNKDADGVSAVMPGKLGNDWQYDDLEYQAEQALGRQLRPAEVSDYYYRLALDNIAADPLHWLALETKKLYLIFSGSDISNNRNLIAFRAQFASLKALPIGMAVLAPLGLVGMVIGFRRSRLTKGMIAFVLLYAFSFVLYFVNSRFRLPILPFLAVLSAIALVEVYRRLRARSYGGGALVAIPAVVLILFLNSNAYRLNFDNQQQALFAKGNLCLSTSNYADAIDNYFRALSCGPPLEQINLNIGLAHLQMGDPDSAAFYFIREDSIFDGSAEALNNLAYLSRRKHEYAIATDYARRALRSKPYLEEARLNLAYALREAGFPDSAYQQLRDYEQSGRLTVRERFLVGVLASDLGRYDESAEILRNVLRELAQRSQPLYAEASGAPSLRLDLNPQVRPAKVFYNLGYVLGASGQLDSAIVYLNRAVASDPGMFEALVNLGSAYFAKRDVAAARDALLRAARINSQNEALMYNLALVSLASNDSTEAISYLQRCLEINPQLAPARMLRDKLGLKQ